MLGMALICLMTLSGCSKATQALPVAIKLTPPQTLLMEISEPVMTEDTNGGLLDYALDLRAWGRQLAARLASIKEWKTWGEEERNDTINAR